MTKKNSAIKIYCPMCHRKVSTWDGKSQINIIVQCRKCNKRIVFHVDSKEIEVKPLLKRNTASGVTFY